MSYLVTILLTISPIVCGFGIFAALWLRDEFYKYPLELGQSSDDSKS